MPDQASQLKDAVELAYCQPAVGAFFNFQFVDEVGLGGWQSGLLWADATPKPSYEPVKALFASIAAGTVDCARFPFAATGPRVAPTTTTATTPPHTTTPTTTSSVAMSRLRRLGICAAVVAAAIAAGHGRFEPAARADPGLLIGVNDDTLKWTFPGWHFIAGLRGAGSSPRSA